MICVVEEAGDVRRCVSLHIDNSEYKNNSGHYWYI
jgi:hypothetical protein